MITIRTRYTGPTNTKGSRIIARIDLSETSSVVTPYDDGLNSEDNHRAAAQACAAKYVSGGWAGRDLLGLTFDGDWYWTANPTLDGDWYTNQTIIVPQAELGLPPRRRLGEVDHQGCTGRQVASAALIHGNRDTDPRPKAAGPWVVCFAANRTYLRLSPWGGDPDWVDIASEATPFIERSTAEMAAQDFGDDPSVEVQPQ